MYAPTSFMYIWICLPSSAKAFGASSASTYRSIMGWPSCCWQQWSTVLDSQSRWTQETSGVMKKYFWYEHLWMYLYSTSLTSGHSKHFKILPNITRSCTHSHIQTRRSQPRRATASWSGAVRLGCLAQGHPAYCKSSWATARVRVGWLCSEMHIVFTFMVYSVPFILKRFWFLHFPSKSVHLHLHFTFTFRAFSRCRNNISPSVQ